MRLANIADFLWGNKAKFNYLLLASLILIFTFLGAREIWTQEHRWADIVSGMFYRHDFLHPYLGETRYYDKPLLSYWLIALIANVIGLTTSTLRLPSALAGLLAIWSIFRLGTVLKNRQLGLLSGWLLLTTYYFIFWARTSSADMLNLAGILFALSWYFTKREKANWHDYTVFFFVLSLTSLCKGLVGIIVPLIAVVTDMWLQKSWRQHLRLPLLLSTIPAIIIYLLPFWASSFFGGEHYGQSGLYLVYRENIMRYFQPFDHQGPIYTYFLYLPIYLLPWAIFFIPALVNLKSRWKNLSTDSKWIAWTLLFLFLFFTLSGSRRSYYVLPLVPFAILFTADWILSSAWIMNKRVWSVSSILLAYVLLFLAVDIVPAWYYSQVGVYRFADKLKEDASGIKPWSEWQVVMLDAESKLNFYLQLAPSTKHYYIKGVSRDAQTTASFAKLWPVLTDKPANTIFITRKSYADKLAGYFSNYHLIELPTQSSSFLKKGDKNTPIAFVPSK